MPDDFHQRHARILVELHILRGELRLDGLRMQVNRAIANRHVDDLIEWTRRLMEQANRDGRLDRQFQTFQTLNRLYASDPIYDPLREKVLWYYKWIAGRLVEYLDVSREQIEQFFSQMELFYAREKESLQPIYKLRCWTANVMQEKEEAARYFKLWQETPDGKSDDCRACQIAAVVEHHLAAQDIDRAVAAAEPIYRGTLRCRTVPASTFSGLLLPLLFAGKGDWAERLRRASFRQVRRWPSMVDHLARHVAFLSLTNRAMYARRPALVMFSRLDEHPSDYHRLQIWRAAWVWSAALAKAGVLQVRIPNLLGRSRMMDVAAFILKCRTETERLTIAFDQRNENLGWSEVFDGLAKFCADLAKRDDKASP